MSTRFRAIVLLATVCAGVVLYGEDRRVVWFGRPPNAEAAGERPSAAKWAALKKAIAHLRGVNDAVPPVGAL